MVVCASAMEPARRRVRTARTYLFMHSPFRELPTGLAAPRRCRLTSPLSDMRLLENLRRQAATSRPPGAWTDVWLSDDSSDSAKWQTSRLHRGRLRREEPLSRRWAGTGRAQVALRPTSRLTNSWSLSSWNGLVSVSARGIR